MPTIDAQTSFIEKQLEENPFVSAASFMQRSGAGIRHLGGKDAAAKDDSLEAANAATQLKCKTCHVSTKYERSRREQIR